MYSLVVVLGFGYCPSSGYDKTWKEGRWVWCTVCDYLKGVATTERFIFNNCRVIPSLKPRPGVCGANSQLKVVHLVRVQVDARLPAIVTGSIEYVQHFGSHCNK